MQICWFIVHFLLLLLAVYVIFMYTVTVSIPNLILSKKIQKFIDFQNSLPEKISDQGRAVYSKDKPFTGGVIISSKPISANKQFTPEFNTQLSSIISFSSLKRDINFYKFFSTEKVSSLDEGLDIFFENFAEHVDLEKQIRVWFQTEFSESKHTVSLYTLDEIKQSDVTFHSYFLMLVIKTVAQTYVLFATMSI